MISRIAAREFTDTVRDGRFRWSAAVVLLLLAASVGAGWKSHRDVKAQHDRAQQEMRNFWVNQPAKNPHSAAHYGLWAFKPRALLSLVDQGVDPYVGVAAYLEAHKQNEFQYRPAMDATATQRFGQWTAAAVLQLLMPLLIIVLAFPAFAGERESGTLRQLLSLGVQPRNLALGKALGVASALGILLVPAAVLGGIALVFASGSLTGPDLARSALLALTYLVYFAVFVAITLLVSASARSSRVALLGLLAFWGFNALVAPRLLSDVARRRHPTPSAFTFVAAIDRDLKASSDGHTPDQRTALLQDSLVKAHNVASVSALPFNFDAVQMQDAEEHGNDVFDTHYGALYETYRQQNTIHQLGAIVAPLLAVRSISMGLAGTDVEHHHAFARSAETYRRMLIRRMNESMAANSRTGDWDYKAPATLWREVPPFTYEAPSVRASLAPHIRGIWILAAWVIIAAGALARLRRLRPD